jgi:hypothetical protein
MCSFRAVSPPAVHDVDGLAAGAQARIANIWEPGVWVGAACRAFGPVSEVIEDARSGVVVENHPPHFIVAMWRTRHGDGPVLRRWPSVVHLTGASESRLVAEMLSQLPVSDRLWLTNADLDWALMAEIVMVSEPTLASWQGRELQAFVRNERARTLAQISRGYTGNAQKYKSFVDTVRDDMG